MNEQIPFNPQKSSGDIGYAHVLPHTLRATPIMEDSDATTITRAELTALKLLHEQQTQSLLAARIEAKLVADELERCFDVKHISPIIPLISRLRKIAEGK